jgi:hypothetical protein
MHIKYLQLLSLASLKCCHAEGKFISLLFMNWKCMTWIDEKLNIFHNSQHFFHFIIVDESHGNELLSLFFFSNIYRKNSNIHESNTRHWRCEISTWDFFYWFHFHFHLFPLLTRDWLIDTHPSLLIYYFKRQKLFFFFFAP